MRVSKFAMQEDKEILSYIYGYILHCLKDIKDCIVLRFDSPLLQGLVLHSTVKPLSILLRILLPLLHLQSQFLEPFQIQLFLKNDRAIESKFEIQEHKVCNPRGQGNTQLSYIVRKTSRTPLFSGLTTQQLQGVLHHSTTGV